MDEPSFPTRTTRDLAGAARDDADTVDVSITPATPTPARPVSLWTLYTGVTREIEQAALGRHRAAVERRAVVQELLGITRPSASHTDAIGPTATPVITSTVEFESLRNPIVAVGRDGATLYVTGVKEFRADDKVFVVDALTMKTTATIAVRANPRSMIVSDDGNNLYVAHFAGDSLFATNQASYVSVIDLNTGKVTSTIKVEEARRSWQYFGLNGGAISMALSPDQSDLYIMSTDSGHLYVVDTDTKSVTQTIDVRDPKGWFQKSAVLQPEGIAVTPDGLTVYITEQDEKTVSTVDLVTGAVVGTMKVGEIGSDEDFPTVRIMAMDSDENLYITNYRRDTVKVVDPDTGKVVKTIRVGDGPADIVVSPDGSAFYVLNWRSQSISVIDTQTGTVAPTLRVNVHPTSVVFDSDGALAYVTGYDAGWNYNVDLIKIGTGLTPVGQSDAGEPQSASNGFR